MSPTRTHRLSLLAVLLATLAGGCFERQPSRTAQEVAPGSRVGAEEPETEIDETLLNETVLYVLADGVAYRSPSESAEPSMKIAAEERYRILEEREGWYRLETQWAEIPAWVPASAVRTAEETAPAHVINERIGEQQR